MNNSSSKRKNTELYESKTNLQRSKVRNTGNDTTRITDLNKSGMSKLLTGQLDEAERFFVQALSHMADVEIDVPSEAAEQIKRITHRKKNLERASCQTLEYSKHEYDEGICPDCDALHWEEHHDEFVKTSILMYNVGQTLRKRKNCNEARKWFDLAVTNIKQSRCSDTHCSIVSIRILQALGFCKYREGNYDDAIQCYDKVLIHLKDSDLGGEFLPYTKNAMALAIFHSTKSPTSVRDTIALFEESLELYKGIQGIQDKEIATVENNLGRAHYLCGDYTEALTCYERALAIRRRLYEKDSIDLAVTICNMGQTYHQLGQLDNAMTFFQEFMELIKHRSDYSSHRDIAIIVGCIAAIHHEKGEFEESRRMYQIALQSGRLAFGNVHSEIASILNKLGSVCYKLDELNLALTYLTEGLTIEMKVYGLEHQNVIVTLLNIAQIHRNRNNFASAFLSYSQIHSIQVRGHGSATLAAANTLFSMGLMLYRLKAYSHAFDNYQEALCIQRRIYGDSDNADVAATLNSIGIVLFNLGKNEMALTYFTESLRMRKALFGEYHPDIATNLYNLATLHLELGNDITATSFYEETLRIERKTRGTHSQEVVQTLQNLGLLYQRNGVLNEALKYIEEALEIERSRSGTDHISVAKLLNMLGNIHLQRGHVENMMMCFSEALSIYKRTNDNLMIAGFQFYELSKLHPECAEAA